MPKGYVTPREIICGGCQLPFMATGTRSRFCSRKCTDKEQWDKKKRKSVICMICREPVIRNYSRDFCSRKCSDRAWHLKTKYNLTVDRFNEILASQDYKCLICDSKGPLHIDHDHACCVENGISCGKCIRGLLCNNCNNGLGRFKDSVDHLAKAIEYLNAYNTVI